MPAEQARYYDYATFLRQYFEGKVQKISVDAGFTCPNRDGLISHGGCTFCNNHTFNPEYCRKESSITQQLQEGIRFFSRKYPSMQYLAYFQAYTNTYGPVSRLRQLFFEAAAHPDIRALSIATRPDCLGPEVLDLLREVSRIKPVWVELGLQTVHERTAAFIRRGYPFSVFEQAVRDLRAIGLDVIVHVILFLPGETQSDMYQTISRLNRMDIQGVKLQLLHILKETDLADYYERHPFYIPQMEDYFQVLGNCVSLLRPDIVIHRITGDGPKELLIAPLWTGDKRYVLNQFHAYLKRQNIWQGRSYIHV